jgi:hypothetical protein
MSMKSSFCGKIVCGHQTLADIKVISANPNLSIFRNTFQSCVTIRDTLAEYLKTENRIKICIQHYSVVASQNSFTNHVI